MALLHDNERESLLLLVNTFNLNLILLSVARIKAAVVEHIRYSQAAGWRLDRIISVMEEISYVKGACFRISVWKLLILPSANEN